MCTPSILIDKSFVYIRKCEWSRVVLMILLKVAWWYRPTGDHVHCQENMSSKFNWTIDRKLNYRQFWLSLYVNISQLFMNKLRNFNIDKIKLYLYKINSKLGLVGSKTFILDLYVNIQLIFVLYKCHTHISRTRGNFILYTENFIYKNLPASENSL